MDITFRPAAPSDAKALFDVKIAAYGDEFREFQYAEQGYQDAVDDCNAKHPKDDSMFSRKWHKMFCSGEHGDWSLVILDGAKRIGQIVAFPGEHFKENYAAYDMSGSVNVIFCVYVLPEYKNRGVGQMAMEHIERLHPADKWILDTPKISPKNKRFYEKCGYTQGQSGSLNVYTKGF
jgi:GNAT superfamily N-acetyltransferase